VWDEKSSLRLDSTTEMSCRSKKKGNWNSPGLFLFLVMCLSGSHIYAVLFKQKKSLTQSSKKNQNEEGDVGTFWY
jgi:hypothetical protein